MSDSTPTGPRWSTGTMSRVASAPTLAEAARRYASLGIPVFPCVPGGKQPLTPTGFHDASASRAVVERWWRRTPEANIGLPTGVAVGVVVVDVDVHDSGSGYAAFDHAHRKGLTQGWGWLVRTPSGGMHAYYPPTGDEQRCWQAPAAHIDFRGRRRVRHRTALPDRGPRQAHAVRGHRRRRAQKSLRWTRHSCVGS